MYLNDNLLCASEFSLAIALTVFVIISVVLAVLLIALAASKGFRTVFFRDKPQKKKSAKKSALAPAEPQPQIETVPAEPTRPRRVSTRRNIEDPTPEYLNAIPTVPLGGVPIAPAPTPAPARNSRRAKTENTAEAKPQEQGGTYTTRSITITRARSAKSNTQQTDRSKKR